MTVRKQVGERLSAARKRLGWPVKSVAREVGREPQTVFRWEWGESEASLEDLASCARVLGVSFGWLVSGEGQMELSSEGTPPPAA